MIHVENGKSSVEGKGITLVAELAMAINIVREVMGSEGENAIQMALKASEPKVMDMFKVKDEETMS